MAAVIIGNVLIAWHKFLKVPFGFRTQDDPTHLFHASQLNSTAIIPDAVVRNNENRDLLDPSPECQNAAAEIDNFCRIDLSVSVVHTNRKSLLLNRKRFSNGIFPLKIIRAIVGRSGSQGFLKGGDHGAEEAQGYAWTTPQRWHRGKGMPKKPCNRSYRSVARGISGLRKWAEHQGAIVVIINELSFQNDVGDGWRVKGTTFRMTTCRDPT